VYFPIRFLDIPASPPHEGNPAYRISFGIEHWADGSAQHVYKVQMVYDGAVAGRKSPSYPEDTDDLDRVYDAIRRIKAGEGQSGRGQMSSIGEEPGITLTEAHAIIAARNL
jgi:hypothetical protein